MPHAPSSRVMTSIMSYDSLKVGALVRSVASMMRNLCPDVRSACRGYEKCPPDRCLHVEPVAGRPRRYLSAPIVPLSVAWNLRPYLYRLRTARDTTLRYLVQVAPAGIPSAHRRRIVERLAITWRSCVQ